MTHDPHESSRARPDPRAGDRLGDSLGDWGQSRQQVQALELEFGDLIAQLNRLDDAPVPSGLVDRIYAASVAMLPMPARSPELAGSHPPFHGPFHGGESRWSVVSTLRRWAPQLSMAASIGLALVIAAPFATVLHRTDAPYSPEMSRVLPAMFAQTTSVAEPMLIALLCEGGDSSQMCLLDGFVGEDDQPEFLAASGLAAAGPEVESLFQARGARYDDIAAEFGRILRDAPAGTERVKP